MELYAVTVPNRLNSGSAVIRAVLACLRVKVPNPVMSVIAFIGAALACLSVLAALQLFGSHPPGPAIARICLVVSGTAIIGSLMFATCAIWEQRQVLTIAAIGLALIAWIAHVGVSTAISLAGRSRPDWAQSIPSERD
jgi:hypothetical protein